MKYFTIYEGDDNLTKPFAVRSVEAKDKEEAENKIFKTDYRSFRGIYTGIELVKVFKELIALVKRHSKEDVFYGQKSILSPKKEDVIWDVLTRNELEKSEFATPDDYYDYYHLSEVEELVKSIKMVKSVIAPVDKTEVTQWLIQNAKKQIGDEVNTSDFWIQKGDENIFNVFQWDMSDTEKYIVMVFEPTNGHDSLDEHLIESFHIGVNEVNLIRAGGRQ